MQVMQVVDELVCTQRVEGLHYLSLRVLVDHGGKLAVAVDPVGAHPGNWVFTMEGTAARFASGDQRNLTDLTIGGIIDHWDEEFEGTRGKRTGPRKDGVEQQEHRPGGGVM